MKIGIFWFLTWVGAYLFPTSLTEIQNQKFVGCGKKMGTEVFDILANALELISDPDLVIRGRFDPFFLPFFRNLSHNRVSQKLQKYSKPRSNLFPPNFANKKYFKTQFFALQNY
jgi:hypothetical protein